MDTFFAIFRRIGLALVGLVLLAMLQFIIHNPPLEVVIGFIFVLPVLAWAVRPRELRSDTPEDFLLYSIFPSVTGVLTCELVVWLMFDILNWDDYGLPCVVTLAGFVLLAHIIHGRMRLSWARAGGRPEWADMVLTGVVMIAGLLGAGKALSNGYSSDSSSLGYEGRRINPTTGLPMMGEGTSGFDIGGSTWGQSSHTDSFSSNPSDPL